MNKEQNLKFNNESKRLEKDSNLKNANKIINNCDNDKFIGLNIININNNANNSIILKNENVYSPLFNIGYKDFLSKSEQINNNFINNKVKSNINKDMQNYIEDKNNSFISNIYQTQNNITNINNININNINIQKFYQKQNQNNNNISIDNSLNYNNINSKNINRKNRKNNLAKNFNNKKRLNTYNNEIINFKIFIENLNTPLDIFICSQTGSRMLQNNLNSFSKHIIDILIDKIKSSFEKLMCDIYGNYFCQKLYNKGSFEQRLLILESIKDSFVSISKTKSGSHVAQSIIEQALTSEEKQKIMSFISNYELEMALDTGPWIFRTWSRRRFPGISRPLRKRRRTTESGRPPTQKTIPR